MNLRRYAEMLMDLALFITAGMCLMALGAVLVLLVKCFARAVTA